jgi:deoxyribodipyrimidine photolyase-related protein
MRRRTGVLMEEDGPVGGKWNYDALNRKGFGRDGPGTIRPPRSFPPDAVTREVIRIVSNRFPEHPGGLERFDWPVTVKDARAALSDFVKHRLAAFGPFQDAMWCDQTYLYHSRLSSSLNLKLLDPRRVLKAATGAHEKGLAPLPSVEGFVRQILGWREFVRGVYWRFMPEYLERNVLGAKLRLPGFYWSADTDMECLRQAIGQTLSFGYAHHIQRLMVTGLFALLLGVDPKEVHRWYLAIYVDAVEWVELPNTLGMSQYADGGIMASKPYVATGKYIQRMSNYCSSCPYRPQKETGKEACPFTTLYWDFLIRHEKKLSGNPRMQLQLRNLSRKTASERRAIRKCGEALRTRWG